MERILAWDFYWIFDAVIDVGWYIRTVWICYKVDIYMVMILAML